MERFGYDPEEADAEKAMGSVYMLLREQVRSDFGLIRGEVETRPRWCDYKDSTKFSTAIQAWQGNLCGVESWTKVEKLDEYLLTPPQKVAS